MLNFCIPAGRRLILCALFGVLTACGGGSEGNATITNGQVLSEGVTPSDTEAAILTDEERRSLVGRALVLINFDDTYHQLIEEFVSNDVMAATPVKEPWSCNSIPFGYGGSVVYTQDDKDRNRKVSSGDTVDIAADECSRHFTQLSMDGKARIEVLGVTGDNLYSTTPGASWNIRTRQTYSNFWVEQLNEWGYANGQIDTESRLSWRTYNFHDLRIVSRRLAPEWIEIKSGQMHWEWTKFQIIRSLRDVVLKTRLPTASQRVVQAIVNTPQPMVMQNDGVRLNGNVTSKMTLETGRELIHVSPGDAGLTRIDVDIDKNGLIDFSEQVNGDDLLLRAGHLFVTY
jgi:hypothetical protein